jgi:phage/plasmid-like protein (TIGR03299 family)
MTANVESIAYVGETPWHGMGHKLPKGASVQKMIEAAEIDWTVKKLPLFAQRSARGGKIAVKDHFALTRNTDNKILDVVGPDYIPVQNKDAFKFFKDFVEAGDATMETAGSLKGGEIVWGLAKLNSSFTIGKSDTVNGYVLLSSPHTQGKALVAKTCAERVVCHNTYTMAMRELTDTFRMTHKTSFDAAMIKKAKETLGLSREQMQRFEEDAKILHKLRLDKEDAIVLLGKVFEPQAKAADLKADFAKVSGIAFKKVVDAYDNAPGAEPGTGWGAFNAVTYWADHVASRTQDRRLTNSWFGSTGRTKEKALEVLLQAAG